MKNIGRECWWLIVVGVLFILTGIRDWVAPGFLSIAGRATGDIEFNLLVGVVFLAAAVRKMMTNQGAAK